MLRAESMAPAPMSPYLSESTHVLSLQYPDIEHSPSEKRTSAYPSATPSPNSVDATLHTIKELRRPSVMERQRSHSQHGPAASTARKLAVKTLKGLQLKLVKESDESQASRQPSEDISPASESVLCLNTECSEGKYKWSKDERGKLKISRKVFGKTPWHRKGSGDSGSSVASSIRDMFRGGTPPATRSSSSTVQAAMSPTTASQYPGGEATRIPTPPLDEDTADGRSRGFFTSSTPPSMDGSLQQSSPIHGLQGSRSERSDVHRRSLTNQPKEWWEQMPPRSSRRDAGVDHGEFDNGIPEHLPSSPLCPAHKKHRGGGTGTCAVHGQMKGSSLRYDGTFMLESDEELFQQKRCQRW